MDAVLDKATKLGHKRAYLFTSGQERYYLDRGWETLHRTTAHGNAASVMSLGLI
jgi:N-acetylglutamate synthase-like GNAT family acetyltransferase